MSLKSWIFLGLFIGSTIGGYIPSLWGFGLFSGAGLIGNTIGGLVGIWVGYKLGQAFAAE